MDKATLLIQRLTETGKTLVTAESCTGGLLGAVLTSVPGASKVYLGGVISYAYSLKEQLLDVDPEILNIKGAICPEVAEQMAQGARKNLNADYALALTGNAGPGTDPLNPNVGEIYVGLATPEGTTSLRLALTGDRQQNCRTAAEQAIKLLLNELMMSPS